MKVSVRIEPEAELQVEELGAWWRVHRPSARSLKAQLREAFKRIAAAPHGGSIYERLGGETIRRVMIKERRTRRTTTWTSRIARP